jgi:hypothetical protein
MNDDCDDEKKPNPPEKVNAFIELHPGDRLDDYFDLRDLTERT